MVKDETERAEVLEPPPVIWESTTLRERWEQMFKRNADPGWRGHPTARWSYAGEKYVSIQQLCSGCGRPLELDERHIFWRDPSYQTGYGEDGHAHLICGKCLESMLEALGGGEDDM